MDRNQSPEARLVLVVEDDDATRSFLLDNLTADGFRVAGASGVGEGLRAIEVRQPSLVVLDLALEDGSGLALLDRVRSFARGADDHVTKPSCRFPQRGIPLVARATVGSTAQRTRRPRAQA